MGERLRDKLASDCIVFGDMDVSLNKTFLCVSTPLQVLNPNPLIPLQPILGVSQPAHLLQWHAPSLTYADVVLQLITRANCLVVSLQINISLLSNHSVVLPQSKSPCEVPSNFSRISVEASSADPPPRSADRSLWISVELHWSALAGDLDQHHYPAGA